MVLVKRLAAGVCLAVLAAGAGGCPAEPGSEARKLLALHRHDEARAVLEQVPPGRRDDSLNSLLTLARVGWIADVLDSEHSEAAQIDEALDLVASDAEVRADPATLLALRKGAASLGSRKLYDRGLRCHELSLGMQRDPAAAAVSMAHWIAGIADVEVQERLYQKALLLAPDCLELFEGEADLLARTGRKQQAISSLSNAIDLLQENPMARDRLQRKLAQLR